MDLTRLIEILASLTSFAGLFSLVVGILKTTGKITDGQSEVVYTGLSIIGLGVVWLVQFFVPTFFPGVPFVTLPTVDAWLAIAVKIGSAILEFLTVWKIGPTVYRATRGVVPLVGYSFSLAKNKAQQARKST